jgi:hypothetical protein
LEVVWELKIGRRKYRRSENSVQRMTQISLGLLLLQSTTCSCTGIEPRSRWARGVVFWADSEARVQIAPSGMMKKRKDGLVISLTPLSALVFDLAMMGLTGQFFRMMSSIVSFVSWVALSGADLAAKAQPVEFVVVCITPRGCRCRRP